MEIKYKHRSFLILLLGAMIFASCKKDTVATTTNVADWPVVISYITPGQPISVSIYQQRDISDTSTYGPVITGLTPTITDGTKTVTLTETTAGTYTYSVLNYLTAGKTYKLQFTYNGAVVTASTVMPAKPTNFVMSRDSINLPLSSSYANDIALSFSWTNPDSLYHVLVFKNDDANAFNIHAARNNAINFSFDTKQSINYSVYYRSLNYLGVYHIMLYRVNKEYINLLNSSSSNTSQQLTNPPTNVVNGYGIFTAIQADTVRLRLVQY